MKQEKIFLAFLAVFYIIAHLPFVTFPFIYDGALYTVMILEQLDHPTLMPTFLGHEVGWKPPLFFWIYAGFVAFLIHLPLPVEAIFKLPTLFFGFINMFLVYLLIRTITSNQKLAFLTSLIYTGIFLVIYTNNTVLIDTLNMTFILAGLFCYLNTKWDKRRFLAGGAFVFLAFFTKFGIALIVPVLAITYFFLHDKKVLRDHLFLLSLLAVPLAYILFSAFFVHEGIFHQDASIEYMVKHRLLNRLADPIGNISRSLEQFLVLAGVWFVFSLYGFFRHFRKHPFMAGWYMFIVIPILNAQLLPWYYLPVIVPIAFFSAKVPLDYKDRSELSGFCLVIIAVLIIAGYAVGSTFYPAIEWQYVEQRLGGEMMAHMDNVVILGGYCPGVPAYKILGERKEGIQKDFGWLLVPGYENETLLRDFLADYHIEKYGVKEGSIGEFFSGRDALAFRKQTNITKPDYLVVCRFPGVDPGGALMLNRSGVRVYNITGSD